MHTKPFCPNKVSVKPFVPIVAAAYTVTDKMLATSFENQYIKPKFSIIYTPVKRIFFTYSHEFSKLLGICTYCESLNSGEILHSKILRTSRQT